MLIKIKTWVREITSHFIVDIKRNVSRGCTCCEMVGMHKYHVTLSLKTLMCDMLSPITFDRSDLLNVK